MREAVDETARLAEGQSVLAQRQAELANTSAATLRKMHQTASALHAQIDASLLQQDALLAGQRDAASALTALDAAQQAVAARVAEGVQLQGELLATQRMMQAEASRAHTAAMDALGSLGRRAADVHAQLAASAVQGEALAAAQVAARVQLDALVVEHRTSLEGIANQSSAVRTTVEFVLQHIASLRAVVVTQFFDIQSVVFYVLAMLATLIASATPRTSGARLPATGRTCECNALSLAYHSHTVLVALAVFERFLLRMYGLDAESAVAWAWVLRRTVTAACVLLLAVTALRHRDYGRLLHSMAERTLHDVDHVRSVRVVT
jgi:hypothetical protein